MMPHAPADCVTYPSVPLTSEAFRSTNAAHTNVAETFSAARAVLHPAK